jgi:hypothetical protein
VTEFDERLMLALGAFWLHGFGGGLLVGWLWRRHRLAHRLRYLLASALGKTD